MKIARLSDVILYGCRALLLWGLFFHDRRQPGRRSCEYCEAKLPRSLTVSGNTYLLQAGAAVSPSCANASMSAVLTKNP